MTSANKQNINTIFMSTIIIENKLNTMKKKKKNNNT